MKPTVFRYSICEPLNPNIIEMGTITADEFRKVLQNFPWFEMLRDQINAEESEIYYSPSLELEDEISKQGISISIINPEPDVEYHIFYKRPKTTIKKMWFKTKEVINPEYVTDRIAQSGQDMNDAFNALLEGDFEMLESRWG